MGAELIPRYVRSGHNLSADGLTRWSSLECEEWKVNHDLTQCDIPPEWSDWESDWSLADDTPALTTYGIPGPLLDFYKTYQSDVAEWRSLLYPTTRILAERAIPTYFLEVQNRQVYESMPDTTNEYRSGDIFLLIGDGVGQLDIDDFRQKIRRLKPLMADFSPPGWFMDSSRPEYWGDTFKIDSEPCADVLMGQWYFFTFGGWARSRCGSTPNARAVRTLSDAYRMAGLEIPPDPVGVVQTRTIENTTGTVISIATDPPNSVYGGDSHIPFPNAPVLRGIGIRWATKMQGDTLTTQQRAVGLGGRTSSLMEIMLLWIRSNGGFCELPFVCVQTHSMGRRGLFIGRCGCNANVCGRQRIPAWSSWWCTP